VRLLHQYTVNPEIFQHVARNIPDHWAFPIAQLARSCATAWLTLAEQLEQRTAARMRE
jgi:hypothetical protein